MEEAEVKEPRSRKKQPFAHKKALIAAAVSVVALGAIGGGYYIYEGQQYQTVFFPNTVVNGLDVSNKTVDEVESLVVSNIGGYTLNIEGREGVTEQITGEEIGLTYLFDGSLETYLSAQQPLEWWNHREQTTEYQVNTTYTIDENMLAERIEKLVFLDDTQMKKPKDAYLSDYIDGQGYIVVPEEDGTVLDKDAVKEAVASAVRKLDTELSLDELGVYADAAVTVDDKELNDTADKLNAYALLTVTYEFGDIKEILDGNKISQWISMDEERQVILNKDEVAAYVAELADKYDTVRKDKVLKTSYGPTVTVTGGTYGWRINQSEESDQLYDILVSGESQSREPVYSQKGASHGETDYGDTYVEINLTAQHLYFYKDGELVVESDLVSGNLARKNDTPGGAYPLTYKQRNTVLRGPKRADGTYSYESPVSYWMPFNGGIGLHDATWRYSFGGNIYKTNGSHGCVNLPLKVAKAIFEQIAPGDPVLCYFLDISEIEKAQKEQEAAASTSAASGSGSSGTSAAGSSQKSSDSTHSSQSTQTKPATQTQPAAQPQSTQPAPEPQTEVSQEAESSASAAESPQGPSGPGGTEVSGGEPGPDVESQAPAGPGQTQNSEAKTPIGPGQTQGPGGTDQGGPGQTQGPGGADQSGPGQSQNSEEVGPGGSSAGSGPIHSSGGLIGPGA